MESQQVKHLLNNVNVLKVNSENPLTVAPLVCFTVL